MMVYSDIYFFFFKQKTAYEMRISDWSSDVCSSDLPLTGALFDYFGGLDDLAAGRVRFIGDPLQRIAEDHLRILRYFRFHARFGDTPDAAGLDACTARAHDLMARPRERIALEVRKRLVARDAGPVGNGREGGRGEGGRE